MTERDYQRKYLRAPYWQYVLFLDKGHVFKGRGLNISEGGILLDEIGHLPEDEVNDFLVYLPEYPLFKNYNFEKIMNFNPEHFTGQSIRFKAKLVRRNNSSNHVNGVFLSQIGFEMVEISKVNLMKLSHYIDVFSGNLIYLQVLLDNINSDKNNLLKFRKLASYLGHNYEEKLSVMRVNIEHEYKSLQWL